MRILRSTAVVLIGASVGMVPLNASAQGSLDDYRRAAGVNQRLANLTVDVAQAPAWIGGDRFWYRKSVKGGNQFVLVDGATGQKSAPFDHARLATALTSAASPRTPFTAMTLPFSEFTFGDGAIEADANGSHFRCTLSDYSCSRVGAAAAPAGGFGGGGGGGGRGNAGAAASGLPPRSMACVAAAAPGGGGRWWWTCRRGRSGQPGGGGS